MTRPNRWTLILTGPNNGVIAKFGDTWAHCPPHFERVNIMEIPADGDVPAPAYWKIHIDAKRWAIHRNGGSIEITDNARRADECARLGFTVENQFDAPAPTEPIQQPLF